MLTESEHSPPLTAICMGEVMLPNMVAERRDSFLSLLAGNSLPLAWSVVDLTLGLALGYPDSARAEVRIVTGTGDHRMGDQEPRQLPSRSLRRRRKSRR